MSTEVMTIPTGTSNSDELNDQRVSNDVELRELIYQSLERDGLITRLKAQLRAAVFKTIEKSSNTTATNSHSPSYDGMNGRICRALVLDWLERSHLLYTEDVFKVETTGSNHPAPLTHTELLEQLHIKPKQNETQPILHALLNHSTNQPTSVNSLPDHIKQSIDNQFPSEKINDLNRIRDHFRSLFSSAFDSNILDVFINKHMPASSTSMPKHEYEKICLKWMQACANALKPQSIPVKPMSPAEPTQSIVSRNVVNNVPTTTPARRSLSPPGESSSTSASLSSSSTHQRKKGVYDFPLPTTVNSNKSVIKKSTDVNPPPLIDFDDASDDNDDDDDDDEEETSASLFSKRNATPTALNHLKNIDNIIQGDITPRTRTTIQKTSNTGSKNIPIEYDDESISQSRSHSIISSVDDITVDKVSPSPSANIDFFDDL